MRHAPVQRYICQRIERAQHEIAVGKRCGEESRRHALPQRERRYARLMLFCLRGRTREQCPAQRMGQGIQVAVRE